VLVRPSVGGISTCVALFSTSAGMSFLVIYLRDAVLRW
jgi:hypothetical protein